MRMFPKAVSRTNVSSLGQRHRGFISNSTRGVQTAGQVARASSRVLMMLPTACCSPGANGSQIAFVNFSEPCRRGLQPCCDSKHK